MAAGGEPLCLCCLLPQLPQGCFEYQILLLRAANKDIVRKPVRMIDERFDRRIGKGHVIEARDGQVIRPQSRT